MLPGEIEGSDLQLVFLCHNNVALAIVRKATKSVTAVHPVYIRARLLVLERRDLGGTKSSLWSDRSRSPLLSSSKDFRDESKSELDIMGVIGRNCDEDVLVSRKRTPSAGRVTWKSQ